MFHAVTYSSYKMNLQPVSCTTASCFGIKNQIEIFRGNFKFWHKKSNNSATWTWNMKRKTEWCWCGNKMENFPIDCLYILSVSILKLLKHCKLSSLWNNHQLLLLILPCFHCHRCPKLVDHHYHQWVSLVKDVKENVRIIIYLHSSLWTELQLADPKVSISQDQKQTSRLTDSHSGVKSTNLTPQPSIHKTVRCVQVQHGKRRQTGRKIIK